MASLQARHSRKCAKGGIGKPWTSFAEAKQRKGKDGKTLTCSCVPMYHVVFRDNRDPKKPLVRESVGHNRKTATELLDVRRGELASGRYRSTRNIRFDEWADEWIEGRRRVGTKENTVRGYANTMDYGKQVFGHLKVRDLEPRDMSRLLEHIRSEHLRRQTRRKPEDRQPISNASLAKHLRQIGACLSDAVKERCATENPVRLMSERPRVEKSEPSYFTDAELARLWPELAARPVYSFLCRAAVATGLRSGELLALRWSDVSFSDRRIEVARTLVARIGETTPKSGKGRRVYLTPEAIGLFEEWFALSGGGDGLVFAKETGGYLDPSYVLRHVLYPALARAGVDRVGEHGRARDFHSFRHTFARLMLEGGAPIVWVQQCLGHSNITLTVNTYGRWSEVSLQDQAAKMVGATPL